MQPIDSIFNRGLFTTQMAYEAGLSKRDLKAALTDGLITKMTRGVYARAGMPYDIYAMIALIYPNGIFAKMSALALYDMTDELPKHIDMAFPNGYSNKNLVSHQIKPFRQQPDRLMLGLTEVTTTSGATVTVYSPTRTLLDIWDDPQIDTAVRLEALKEYMSRFRSSQSDRELMHFKNKLYPNSTIDYALEVLV
ncbi:type IV toxin-antitoxin system AbiEi family antitoxin domain-containing protein [Lacticaseibacillus mingshuiensis]|uniref:type IV toxin-antitoxin system AbiEi family antitoxin domain-containing protein n=1 Tax=Lacticaseibacillus mingshuiensis TaxID=2799574 RepID=UPI001951DB1C|nr:type IV toxin-antitoxin system AbiEi family antitoxin domain-containing protein [Lacticaseibacillus mingshuiensis]